MSTRPLRLLALSTAAAMALTLAPGAAFASDSDRSADRESRLGTADSAKTVTAPAPASFKGAQQLAPGSFSTGDFALKGSVPASAKQAAPAGRAIKKHWPVRLRSGSATTHIGTPSGDVAQRFVRALIQQDRLTSRIYADVTLQGVPTSATTGRLVIAMGRPTSTSPCFSPAGNNYVFDSNTYARGTNRIRIYAPVRGAKNTPYTCAFAQMLNSDETAAYDGVIQTRLAVTRQRPILGFRIKGKRLKNSGYTRVPVRIFNSKQTVATAPKVRLIIRTRGPVKVRWNPKVGTIKPGGVRRGAIFVDKSGLAPAKIIMIVKSREYRRKITVPVTSRRS